MQSVCLQITFIDSLAGWITSQASYSVGVPGTFFSGVKWLGHEVLICPSGASIKNEWSHTLSLPYVFMACAGTDLIYSITTKMGANKIYSYSCFLCNECDFLWQDLNDFVRVSEAALKWLCLWVVFLVASSSKCCMWKMFVLSIPSHEGWLSRKAVPLYIAFLLKVKHSTLEKTNHINITWLSLLYWYFWIAACRWNSKTCTWVEALLWIGRGISEACFKYFFLIWNIL